MVTENILLIASSLVIIFLLSSIFFYVFLFSRESEIGIQKREIEKIVRIIERAASEKSKDFYYCFSIKKSNITINNSRLEVEIDGKKFVKFLPVLIKDCYLVGVSDLCVSKKDSIIELSELSNNMCNFNGVCENLECLIDCPDCRSSKICYGDGYCNEKIGENCLNSPDCACSKDEVCCPSSLDADKKGCSKLVNLKKGERCWCDNQCSSGLACNPTTFNPRERVCCETGKVWNGSHCIQAECFYPCVPGCKLPKRWDWRNVSGVNYLNPLRDQGSCGSCWAFSAIGAVEGVYNVEVNCPACNKDLSEQQLVSNDNPCCNSCGDCNGGVPHYALNYIKNIGVVRESCCSYRASSSGCPICSDFFKGKRWKIKKYEFVSNDIEEIKRALICKGPLSVATPWSPPFGHAIVLVGYDDDSEICKRYYSYPGCWIIRNSWGPVNGMVHGVWHENGYGYIPYEGILQSNLKNYVLYVEGVIER